LSTAEYNVRAAGALIDELAKSGVRHLCMAPGSRSSPLVLAADRHPDIVLYMITDERSAAFFALGIAKASGEPAAVGCTSGTAAVNFGPAIVEAALAHVPLIVLTADRPPEQVDVSAAQTIRQTGLFTNHARWSVAAPVPDASLNIDRAFRNLGARLAAVSRTEHGPVHANLPLREPLWDERADQLLAETRRGGPPATRVAGAHPAPDSSALEQLGQRLSTCTRGVIVAGPRDVGRLDVEVVTTLAEKLGWPILADGLSEMRPSVSESDLVLDTHEILARCPSTSRRLQPDAVIRIGAPPTSKALSQLLNTWNASPHVVLTARKDWPDPSLLASDIVGGDPSDTLRALGGRLTRNPDRSWLHAWISAAERARSVLTEASTSERFEGALAHAVVASLAPGDQLVVGNSMPVRDLDTFAANLAPGVRVHANRGANGIDGVMSTALGIAAASDARTVALIGDLSFVHDIGALQIAKRHAVNLTVVVPNNDGGGIFNFLPKPTTGFEELFATPHGLDLGNLVRAHGIGFISADNTSDVVAALAEATNGPCVIEMCFDREDNARIRNNAIAAAAAAVEAAAEAAA
jgi:2-succinyl-5-enolpyruvyl-6-hydroxy-3-cyclohexene-1-carboxylate synthase